MNPFTASGLAACIALALTAGSAQAETRCRSDKVCRTEPQKSQGQAGKTSHGSKQRAIAPRIGDSAKDAPAFRPDRASGLGTPPRGREYRVVRDRVVLVDSATLKVLQVLGATASALR